MVWGFNISVKNDFHIENHCRMYGLKVNIKSDRGALIFKLNLESLNIYRLQEWIKHLENSCVLT